MPNNDNTRRLRYQEKQRIQQKIVNAPNNVTWCRANLSGGQLKNFASKLVK